MPDVQLRGKRGADRAWDVLMLNARRQAEDYVRLLPTGHEPPPFVIVCDVGHCFEIYANFRRDGKAFDQFPDRQSFRIFLDDLRRPEIRETLHEIWTEPQALDPAKKSARVTRAIAEVTGDRSRFAGRPEAGTRPVITAPQFGKACFCSFFVLG